MPLRSVIRKLLEFFSNCQRVDFDCEGVDFDCEGVDFNCEGVNVNK